MASPINFDTSRTSYMQESKLSKNYPCQSNTTNPEVALWKETVLAHPDPSLPVGVSTVVRGYDFNDFSGSGDDYSKLLASYSSTGFQASALSDAMLAVNLMLAHKYEDENAIHELEERRARRSVLLEGHSVHPGSQIKQVSKGGDTISNGDLEDEQEQCDAGVVCEEELPSSAATECAQTPSPYEVERPRAKTGCTIFLSFTSNCITCGLRETIRFLAQHNMVDCIVTTCGGIEEDLIKCLTPFYLGDFYRWKGPELRHRGINRTGNIFVPNANYCALEDWIIPIFDRMFEEQQSGIVKWTPSRVIARLGKEINNPDSFLYWAYKNNIPVYSPALTDGSLGDMLFYHTFKTSPGLSIDIVEDLRMINLQAMHARHSGIVILGGGLIKHHVCNANLMRNGADWSVYINTATELDGSDAGARPDEAISWGKIRPKALAVKVYSDASLVFPLLVAETFAKWHLKLQKSDPSAIKPENIN